MALHVVAYWRRTLSCIGVGLVVGHWLRVGNAVGLGADAQCTIRVQCLITIALSIYLLFRGMKLDVEFGLGVKLGLGDTFELRHVFGRRLRVRVRVRVRIRRGHGLGVRLVCGLGVGFGHGRRV